MQNIGAAAARTLDAALTGRRVYIPGLLNRSLRALGGLVPPALVARFIGRRWQTARSAAQARAGDGAGHLQAKLATSSMVSTALTTAALAFMVMARYL